MTPTQTVAALAAADPDPSDAALLGRFAAARDEAAFAAVVRRHARLVWAVCRRAAAHHHDAEDAFQATFLVLARHPGKPQGSAAGFLFGVARRLAARARRKAARPSTHLAMTPSDHGPDPATAAAVRELQAVLDDEIARLPATYREAFLACVNGGRSREHAAVELGVNPGTLSARLARARLLLRNRLAKRGVQLSAALAVTDLAAHAAPPALVRSAVATGVAGWGARGAVGWGAVVAGLVGCVAVVAALTAGGQNPPVPPPPAPPAPAVVAGPLEEPLPAGAAVRLGSTRWRHWGDAQGLSFSPDGATLVVMSTNGADLPERTLTLFDAASGRVLNRRTATGGRAAAFSPNGAFLATLSARGTVELRHPRSLERLRTLALDRDDGLVPDRYARLVFSADGRRLAAPTGPRDQITVWDVPQGRVVTTIIGHNNGNPPLAFTPDGTALVMGVSEPDVQVWDTTTGKKLRGFDTGGPAFSIAVSADGAVVASGGRDEIALSDARTGKELARLKGDPGSAVLDLAFTPDGKTLVSDSEGAKARVWDVATGKVKHVLDSRGWMGRSMALSADGRRVAIGTVYNIVRVWDVATGQEVAAADDGHDAPVHAVAVSPDGKSFVTGGSNQQIRVWDAATGRPVRRLPGASASQMAFSADGRRLVTAWEWGDKARVWDLGRGEPLTELPAAAGHKAPLATFTPDGTAVVTASSLREVEGENFGRTFLRTWDAAAGKADRELTLKGLRPRALAVSPDGTWAAVGGYAGNGTDPGPCLRWWDLRRDRDRPGQYRDVASVEAAVFSPDSRLLATGGCDCKARLWEAATGREVLTLDGHERSVAAVGFTPDGRVLVTADGGPQSVYWKGFKPPSVRFWDVATGRELARLGGHGTDVTSLAVTPDGKRVLTGLADGSALAWTVPPAATPSRRGPGPRAPAALWADLASDDAPAAYAAVQALAADPDRAAPYLKQSLRPVPPPDLARLHRHIADLDSTEFATREAASKELAGAGEEAREELARALAATQSPEVRRRLGDVLTRLDNLSSPERRQEVRAVWALELIHTPAARAVLTELASGAAGARLTREARTALERR